MPFTLRPVQALRLWHDVTLDDVTKPVITRALDTMGGLDLVSRRRDDLDRRNVIVQRTVRGSLFLEKLADRIAARAADLPA
jgi:DNA-binding MarR family transcriptional regulator